MFALFNIPYPPDLTLLIFALIIHVPVPISALIIVNLKVLLLTSVLILGPMHFRALVFISFILLELAFAPILFVCPTAAVVVPI